MKILFLDTYVFWYLCLAIGCASRTSTQALHHHSEEFDAQFLHATLDHQTENLRNANTCAGKHVHQELLRFCAALREDQQHEFDQMSSWFQAWYQKKPSSDPFPLWLDKQDGETFERFFLKDMLEGHRGMAARAADCVKNAKHPELANFCKEVTTHRTEESHQMEQWNCQWFKECH